MYPLTVGLAIETKELWEGVQSCVQDLAVRVVIEQQDVADFPGFRERVERMRPDILLLEIAKLRVPLEEVVRNIRSLCPEIMLIALHASAEPETILSAMRAGVNEFLNPPLAVSLRQALERRANERSKFRGDPNHPGGKTQGFLSAKGGCGATTIACHAAVELGRLGGRKVLLADFDMDAGMIGFLMKVKSPYSILDAVKNLQRLDASYWRALVSNGIPGVEIIAAPGASAFRPQPKEEQLRQVLGFLRSHYDHALVDLGRSLNPVALSVIEELDEVYLVTTLEVPAMHRAKHIIQTLFDSGFGKDRLRLILNRVPKRVDVTPEELEKMLGLPAYAMLPNDYPSLHDCYSEGKLLGRGSNLAQQLARFAAKLAGVLPEAGKKKFSLFG
jgi:pilus assembly protein CpaE